MLNFIKKCRVFTDTKVSMVILMDNIEQLGALAEAIIDADRERFVYEVYKNEITLYMMEVRMPYNRYIAMLKGLHKRGWNLAQETKADIFNRMVKYE